MEKQAGLPSEVIRQFAIYGEVEEIKPFGSGHINLTFLSQWNQAGVRLRYTHQRINDKVFTRPDEVMENIDRVTGHIRDSLRHGSECPMADTSRRTLMVVPARDGKLWVRDREGGWWRTYLFIEGCHTLEQVSAREEAGILGKSIARFQSQLAGLGGPRLHEAIPGFHDMEMRYMRFHEAVLKDSRNRARDVKPEIDFMLANEERGAVLIRSMRSGTIPERICHNDCKINNILIDDISSEALCVIDLDTVMPGTPLYDVGDLIRTVSTSAAEDERDLSKVQFDLGYFESLLSGYLSGAMDFLVPAELPLLFEAGRNLTQIMGLRFLTDYIEGDHYYRISRPDHNLDRCRNQIALIKSMDSKHEAAEAVIEKLCNNPAIN